MTPFGISAQSFRTRPSSARFGDDDELPNRRRDRVRIYRVATAVTCSSAYRLPRLSKRTGDRDYGFHNCSVIEKEYVRPIFHRYVFAATVRPTLDRTAFASPPSNFPILDATKFRKNELAVYRAHRFWRTSDPMRLRFAGFLTIIGRGRRVKVRSTIYP